MIWTVLAASMGGGLFALLGVVFIIVAAVIAVCNFSNASRKNRFSAFDITDDAEEPDPLNLREAVRGADGFCPYCGTQAEKDYEYCKKCGKKLPKGE